MPKLRPSRPSLNTEVRTRSGNRRASSEERLKQKLIERLTALGDMLERRCRNTYRDNIGALIYLEEGVPAPQGLIKVEDEKAPDLATGGSPNVVIPGEDPGPPETQAPAAVPVRRAARWTGMTVLTD